MCCKKILELCREDQKAIIQSIATRDETKIQIGFQWSNIESKTQYQKCEGHSKN